MRRDEVRVYARTYRKNRNDPPLVRRWKHLEEPNFYYTVANCLSVEIPTLDHTLSVYRGTLKRPAVIITCDREHKSEVWFRQTIKGRTRWMMLRRKPFLEKVLIPFAVRAGKREAALQAIVERSQEQERRSEAMHEKR